MVCQTRSKALSSIQVHDKSDFFTALVKASRLLMGNDTEQPGHLIYITDGRLVMTDLQVRSNFCQKFTLCRNESSFWKAAYLARFILSLFMKTNGATVAMSSSSKLFTKSNTLENRPPVSSSTLPIPKRAKISPRISSQTSFLRSKPSSDSVTCTGVCAFTRGRREFRRKRIYRSWAL